MKTWLEMLDSHIIIHLLQGVFRMEYRSVLCRDFTIICITEKLEVEMSAYTSFISGLEYSV